MSNNASDTTQKKYTIAVITAWPSRDAFALHVKREVDDSWLLFGEFSTLKATWRAFVDLEVLYDWKNDSGDAYGIIAAAKSFSSKDPVMTGSHFSPVTIATAIEIVIEAFCTPIPVQLEMAPVLQNQCPAVQYYYKNSDCTADNSTDAGCICWHDVGTGPNPKAIPGFLSTEEELRLTWRTKPKDETKEQ